MSSITLQKLLDYCQSDGRICPFPDEWQRAWNRLPEGKKRQANSLGYKFPPTPLVLHGWYSTKKNKREHLLVQIYWSSIHGGFDRIFKYLMELEDSRWYMPGNKGWNDSGDYNEEVKYMSLADVELQYELMKK